MSDLIKQTREYADLSEVVTTTCYDEEHEEWTIKTTTIGDVLDSVCDDYTVFPSTQQWISVSERLPVWERWYIVTIDVGNSSYSNYTVSTLYWKDGKWHDYACGGFDEFNMPVIAWMKLPEPYKVVILSE